MEILHSQEILQFNGGTHQRVAYVKGASYRHRFPCANTNWLWLLSQRKKRLLFQQKPNVNA